MRQATKLYSAENQGFAMPLAGNVVAKSCRSKDRNAWRKIEEIAMFKSFCHNIEFFDEHLEGGFDDYLV